MFSQRPLYLLIYPSRLFPAHWALWIPSSLDNSTSIGTRIHVQGSPHSGYNHEFSRNYDITEDERQKVVIFLGSTDCENVVDDGVRTAADNVAGPYCDTVATDALEEWALRVPAPGASLRSAAEKSDLKTRVVVRNCQTWMRELVVVLIENGILEGDALAVVDGAPKN